MPLDERRDDAKDSQWGGDGGDDDGGGGRDDDNGDNDNDSDGKDDNDNEGGGSHADAAPDPLNCQPRACRGIDERGPEFFCFCSSARKSHRLPATIL